MESVVIHLFLSNQISEEKKWTISLSWSSKFVTFSVTYNRFHTLQFFFITNRLYSIWKLTNVFSRRKTCWNSHWGFPSSFTNDSRLSSDVLVKCCYVWKLLVKWRDTCPVHYSKRFPLCLRLPKQRGSLRKACHYDA